MYYNEDERWARIQEFEDYLISDFGRVYCASKDKIKTHHLNQGYPSVSLKRADQTKSYLIHRLVAVAFVPGRSNERNIVNHIDGDKTNTHYVNLEWVTSCENTYHAIRTGLRKPNPPGGKYYLRRRAFKNYRGE